MGKGRRKDYIRRRMEGGVGKYYIHELNKRRESDNSGENIAANSETNPDNPSQDTATRVDKTSSEIRKRIARYVGAVRLSS